MITELGGDAGRSGGPSIRQFDLFGPSLREKREQAAPKPAETRKGPPLSFLIARKNSLTPPAAPAPLECQRAPVGGAGILTMKSWAAPDSAPQISPLRPANCRTLA